jgi:hypothetical protein
MKTKAVQAYDEQLEKDRQRFLMDIILKQAADYLAERES